MSIPKLPNVFTPALGANISNVSTSLTTSVAVPDAGHVWMIIDGEGLDGDASGTTVSGLNRASFKVNGVASAASHSAGAIIYFVSVFEAMQGSFASKIDDQQPGAGTGTVTFGNPFPTNFTDLEILWEARGDTAANSIPMQIRFNSDVGANYDYQYVQGQAATASAAETFAQTQGQIADLAAATATANYVGSGRILVPNYNSTTNVKKAICNYAVFWGTTSTTLVSKQFMVKWRSTAAITKIDLFPSTGNFAANGRFRVFGLP